MAPNVFDTFIAWPGDSAIAITQRLSDSPVIELRHYTLRAGQRNVITLSEAESVESQEAVGMKVVGTFRDLDNPDWFLRDNGRFQQCSAAARCLALIRTSARIPRLKKELDSAGRRDSRTISTGGRIMRRIVAAMQISADGFIEGPRGEVDWVRSWEDPFDLLAQIDTCILGRRMFAGYEQYWRAVLANPDGPLALTGRPPTPGEVAYARFADNAAHIVVSTNGVETTWRNTRIVRSLDEIRELKQQPGKDMHVVGGATLVSSLLNAGFVDEIRMVVQPIVLGGGTAMFKDVVERHPLRLDEARALDGGLVRLRYHVHG